MKHVDLIRAIEGFGCVFVRHDWYRSPATRRQGLTPMTASVVLSRAGAKNSGFW